MRFAALLLSFLFLGSSDSLGPFIPYFANVREVHVAQPERQNYFVVDEELWNHARPDLGDLRLYDADSLVQYALMEQSAGIASDEVEAKILNLGTVSGRTEFDLDTQGLAEYDRIRLRLDAHDFVITAAVSGGSATGQAAEVQLPPSTLYDFKKERLGSNFQIKIPTSSFRYLHIKLSPGIKPEWVKGATIFNLHEQKAAWVSDGSCSAPQKQGRTTLIACDVPKRVPLNRISFDVASEQVNFRRAVSVEDSNHTQIAAGEIGRVRVNREGTLVTSEELFVSVSGNPGSLLVKIDNGENPPLTIKSATPLSVEHRVYFDPAGKDTLRLYYGDEKLSAPAYDYARFFHRDDLTAEAQLGPGMQNPRYKPRPDERPWSEQHTVILWTVMILAVLILSLLAFRGLSSMPR